MWKFKTDRMGNIATAVARRVDTYICNVALLGKKDADDGWSYLDVDLNSQKNRVLFGYNYLEWKDE